LAVERTMLAWWRTGLAALAVALAVGRILPSLDEGANTTPYVVIGLAFSVYAIGLFGYGAALGLSGSGRMSSPTFFIAAAGALLGMAIALLIALA
jgi:uncharacterized membrane protein YidH (DUF202 family)